MNYEVIALACEQLSYRDKLRLAQALIQAARKEEEIQTLKIVQNETSLIRLKVKNFQKI